MLTDVDQAAQAECFLAAKALLRERLDEVAYSWVSQMVFDERVNGTIKVLVPFGVTADRISRDFSEDVGRALQEAFEDNVGFELVIDERLAQLPEEPDHSRHAPQRQLFPARVGKEKPAAKVPFISDDGNLLVKAALKDFLSDGPLSRRGIICIHGEGGSGKSCLIENALSWYRRKNPTALTLVENASGFMHAFFSSCVDKSGLLFSRRREESDLWVIEDFQHLTTKKEDAACHRKFLEICKVVTRRQGKIIIASQVPLGRIKVSRDLAGYLLGVVCFEMGMLGVQGRGEIVQRITKELNLPPELVPPIEALQALAQRIENTKELIAKTQELLFGIKTLGLKMGVTEVGEWLDSKLSGKKVTTTPLSCQSIVSAVEDHYSLKPGLLAKRDRSQRLASPRQLAAYLMDRLIKGITRSQIAQILGHKDDSTVAHSISTVEKMLSGERVTPQILLAYDGGVLLDVLQKIAKKAGGTLNK